MILADLSVELHGPAWAWAIVLPGWLWIICRSSELGRAAWAYLRDRRRRRVGG